MLRTWLRMDLCWPRLICRGTPLRCLSTPNVMTPLTCSATPTESTWMKMEFLLISTIPCVNTTCHSKLMLTALRWSSSQLEPERTTTQTITTILVESQFTMQLNYIWTRLKHTEV
jgi:hypothetical protein